MGDMIQYFHGDVKRINHALKVYYFASLNSKESGSDEREELILCIAALLMISGSKRQNENTSHLQENTRSGQNP